MARRDLAGLAALGALGMMMAKRKGKADMDIDPESADRANAISRGRTNLVDTGMSTPEPGEAPRLNENYSNEGRTGTLRTPVGAASTRRTTSSTPSVGGRENARDELLMRQGRVPSTTEAGMRNYVPRRTPQANSTTEAGMRNYVSRAPTDTALDTTQADIVRKLAATSGVPMSGMSSPQRLDEAGNPYKKGGKVKKMANGGVTRSSASKRADGIAQRGKTRGKMY